MDLTGDLDFKDDGYIELVLRILGLMCDNQHFEIQVSISQSYSKFSSIVFQVSVLNRATFWDKVVMSLFCHPPLTCLSRIHTF